MASLMEINTSHSDAIPSLWLAKKSLQGHNTPLPRRHRSTSAAELCFIYEWFRVARTSYSFRSSRNHCLELGPDILLSQTLRTHSLCWSSLGIALKLQFGCNTSGFHRYEPMCTQELLPGDAVFSTF